MLNLSVRGVWGKGGTAALINFRQKGMDNKNDAGYNRDYVWDDFEPYGGS